MKRFTRDEIAQLVARDIPEGCYVNLGIGLPTLVANHLEISKDIFLHSENGLLGMGPAPAPGEEDEDLINAGKQPVTMACAPFQNRRNPPCSAYRALAVFMNEVCLEPQACMCVYTKFLENVAYLNGVDRVHAQMLHDPCQ